MECSHRRQFVIYRDVANFHDFCNLKISDTKVLSFHKELPVTPFGKIRDNNKYPNVFIGVAFHSDKEIDILEELEELDKISFYDITSSWCGRWACLIDGELFLDASGSIQCFYSDDGSILSSSLTLLQSVRQFDFDPDYNYCVSHHKDLMNWYPAPYTVIKGIKKLIVGQVISFESGKIRVERYQYNKYSTLSDEEIIDKIGQKLKRLVSNIENYFEGDIILPLTSGYDSRTILAALLAQEIEFNSYTQQHAKISHSDKTIPNRLAKKYGFNHSYLKSDKINKQRYQEYINFSFNQAQDSDINFYACGQYDSLSSPVGKVDKIILRGGVWEVGRKYYSFIDFDDNEKLTTSERYSNLEKCFPTMSKSTLHQKSILEWIRYIYKNPSELAIRSRFYLEQRVSGWLSATEQGLDIIGSERIHLANSTDIISLLSSYKRLDNPQRYIISSLKPSLIEYEFNGSSYVEKLLRKFKLFYWKILSRRK